ncbi:NAD(+) synthase [Anaerofilum sp. BX8]|uniref:Glutamine-dependent NAD(+) synthetase n=1 Tax=Anaerofilum hominis TaxID=2763016 RepID=A0A923L0C5_9FIRM|nr:NAD(+) synthase [Anaerofilum hominis]MBC5580220.1 NAD(+) synthase [Anaerofilum hominis]
MKDGFIKVAAASPKLRVADCDHNLSEILKAVRRAADLGVQVLVLPELCLTGYTCGDLFFQDTLLDGAQRALETLARETRGLELLIVAGLPWRQDSKLYNCAAVLCRGQVLGLVPKVNLPNYGEFYERRQFTPAFEGLRSTWAAGREVPFGAGLLFRCRELPALCLGVEICEDLWVPSPPSVRLALGGATLIANPSASDETTGKAAYRRTLVCSHSARLLCGYIYADAGAGESTGDMVFAGHNLIAENGALLAESPLFSEGVTVSEIDVARLTGERARATTFAAGRDAGLQTVEFSLTPRETALTRPIPPRPFVPDDPSERARRCEEIFSIQAAGLCKRVEHTGCGSLVIGISGGLDSCLALLVAVRALDRLHRPRTDLIAVTMPCFGTTSRTKSNAELLCKALGVTFNTVDISEAVRVHFRDIGHSEAERDVVYENAQARERTQVLMDIANDMNGLVVGTGDLSELALGWATYNGDHMSMYGVNAAVPKTLVRHMVGYAADSAREAGLREVLLDILDTPVSPELLPADGEDIAQRTEDIVGPYDLHDFYLYYVVRFGFSPRKIYRMALLAFEEQFSAEEILKWLKIFYRRFFSQQFKRSCLPDGPKVGSVSLSPRGDWRMPSDACSALWIKELEEL